MNLKTFYSTLRQIFFLVATIGLAVPAIAQINGPTEKIVQSPYYDALGLYYGLQGIPAFPVSLGPTDNVKAARAWKGAKPAPTNFYKIIETATGKILQDTVASTDLKTVLPGLKVTDAEIQPVITAILIRNAGLKEGSDWSTVLTEYQTNSYLKSFLTKNGPAISADKSLTADLANISLDGDVKGGSSQLGNIILNGVTDFYIQRVNDEIDAAFFVQLTKILDKYKEIGILFPQSKQALTKVQVTHYKGILNVLKGAFINDIRQLPGNIPKLASLPRYSDLINEHSELTLLFAGLDVIYQANQRTVPAEILQRMDTASYITKTKPNAYRAVIQMAALTSYCFRDIKAGDQNKETSGWVDTKKIDLFRTNQPFFKIFMGLYTQNARDITFISGGKNFDFKAALNNNSDAILKGQYLIYNFLQLQSTITTLFKNQAATDTAAGKKAELALTAAQQILSFGQTAANILPSNVSAGFLKVTTDFQADFLPVARQASDLVANVEAKQYSQAVYKADTLLGTVFDLWKKYNKSLDSKDKDIKTITDDHEDVRRYFDKYGLFIAAVAEAKKPEDVKNALNAFALPTGSSRIKKETNMSFGIGSYVGFYHSWNKQYKGIVLPNQETGLTVPIGFEFNKGHFLGGSLSAFVGVIDIGAIFSYKVASDSTLKSDVRFQQLLSPSVGIVYGLPIISKFNIPLSIGANMQWGPRLKSVNDAGNSVLPLMAGHFNIFIALDIPVVNFYTSKK